jgi:lauroyl/myristoyl acyltransferase
VKAAAREEVALRPPHAPEAGAIRRWLGPLYVTGAFWYRFHLFGVTILPESFKRAAMFLCVCFFSVTLRRIRRGIVSNLEAVLGPCGWLERHRRAWRTLHDFAWCLSERYEQLGGIREATAEIEGLEHWGALDASPRGFVFVTAHFGNWESASLLPGRAGRRVHLVRELEMDPRAQAFLEAEIRRRAPPGHVTHFAADDAALGPTLLAALRRGDTVALQADRPRAGRPSLRASLFGRPIDLPPGPAALARAAEVPLVPVFAYREGRLRYTLEIRPPIPVPATSDRDGDIREAVAKLASEVERAIRRRPHHWFCFTRLWPSTS